MIYVRRERFVWLVLSSEVTNISRVRVRLLVTAGLLAGVLLSTYHQLRSQLTLLTDIQEFQEFQEFQEWLLEKERINDHIVKVCEKYGDSAREKLKTQTWAGI